MELQTMVEDIISDLGGDILSLAISQETISKKISESLRKVGAYAPIVKTESFPVIGETIKLPEGTIAVHNVLSAKDISHTNRGGDDVDIFSASTYMLGNRTGHDPMEYLIQRNELDTMMNFIEVTDWYYVPDNKMVYLNYYNRPTATIKYLKKYTSVTEITDDSVLDIVKNYALALCKIIEGGIRRKLSEAPGAMVMDGDALVQEGKEEKTLLEEQIKKEFSNIRFGIRA